MNNSPYSLGERTITFSKDILAFCKSIPITSVTGPLVSQLVRSATSIGANYAEANNAVSKSDFRNKIFIAKKETAETEYWLTLLEDFSNDETCQKLKQECHYLLMTFLKIVNTLRNTENGKRKVNSEQ